ncbi:MAG: hypothetical protein LKE89_08620, partial [Lactobacillaceae bacterium]|nr:hypothetical protein [Lactobacillaceae bacterium]
AVVSTQSTVMLGRSRGLFAYQKDQAQQQWLPGSVPLTDLNDEKLLIFGAGHIGQMLAKRASALGYHCLWCQHCR